MDYKRISLYFALFIVSYLLWINWQQDYPNKPPTKVSKTVTQTTGGTYVPHVTSDHPEATISPSQEKAPVVTASDDVKGPARTIEVKTDVLGLTIDLDNGDVIAARLLDYPQSLEDKNTPFPLLTNQPFVKYVANSSLFVSDKKGVETLNFHFTSGQSVYQLQPGEDSLTVTLKGKDDQGLVVDKTFKLNRGEYLVHMGYNIRNDGDASWQGYLNTQLLRAYPKQDKSSMFHVGSYTGASYSNPEQKLYQKLSYADMTKGNLDKNVTSGWVAMQEHYFLTAWIPKENSQNRFYSRAIGQKYIIGTVSAPIKIAPGKTAEVGSKLYAGPEITDVLKGIAPGLNLTVDYGWLWFISMFLFWVMKHIYNFVGNWGWSIVLVTVLIKLAFYQLSAKSYRSMANMRRLQPKLEALKERCGDDKAKLSQATMELYRSEKVNPLGGCLPILVQIPVFIALYWVLLESVQLRQAPFILWIHDLAAPDPLYILPIIMGATMFLQQRLNPAPPDPTQAKVMMALPVVFTFLFLNFPSGLVLYWVVNNSLSILQQWLITRNVESAQGKGKGKQTLIKKATT